MSSVGSSVFQLSGYNSGLPVDDIITQLLSIERRPIDLMSNQVNKLTSQQTQYNNVKTRVDALLTSLKALTADSSIVSTKKDLFKAKTASVANTAVAGVSVTDTAAVQNFQLEVLSLATATKAASTAAVGQPINAATPLASAAMGTISTGSFTIYVNGVANSVAVNSGETVGDVLNRISSQIPAIATSIDPDGKVHLTYADGTNVQLGSGGDTSNFLTAMKLTTGVFTDLGGPDSEIASQGPVLAINLNTPVDDVAAGTVTAVTSGTFTINGVSFDTTGKSLNEIISAINNSNAKVTAGFNPNTNAFELIASTPGSALINLADGTSNFLTAMGLITGGDSTSSQVVGANAQFKINNGPVLYSPTNSVSDAVSGLSGVTLDLKTSNVGSPTTVNITRDNAALTTAMDDLVKKFNDVLSYIDALTKSAEDANSRGILSNDRTLIQFRNELRQMFTDSIVSLTGTGYDSLPAIGISTGVSTGVLNNSSTMIFDKAKFEAALAANPDAIRKLLSGVSATDGFDGVLQKLQTKLKNAVATQSVDGQDGIFASYSNSVTARIKSLNEAIKRGEDRLVKKEAMLRAQYAAMDQLIGQYKSQQTAIDNLNKQLAASNK